MEQSFINLLFPATNNNYILIWRLPEKISKFFENAEAAQSWLESQANKNDLYIGAGLSNKDNGEKFRCKAGNITGICGAWLDIDIFNEKAHKKKNLPKTIDEALKIIESMPIPTIIVNSGHGLQAWWLFDEMWNFNSSEENRKAAVFTKAWTDLTKDNAAKLGYDVDSTGDLARVLRIPGTMNNKIPSEPIEVTIYQENKVRYNKDELFNICRQYADNNAIPKVVATFIPIALDENAVPPFYKFNQLMNNNAKFKKTFNYQRKDLIDQSPSSYDFSLIMQTLREGWSNEEITALLIGFRRTNNQDLKFDRKNDDYYVRSIASAREKYDEKSAENDFKKAAIMELSELEQMDSGEMSVDDIIQTINERLNIQIQCITKYLTDPPQFRLIMQDGKRIMLGEVGNLIGQTAFRKCVAAVAGVCIKTFKQAAWDIIAQLLLSACIEEEMDAESTESGYITSSLRSYLEVRKVIDDIEVGIAGKRPFYATIDNEKYIQFFGEDFRKWLFMSTGERLAPKEMGIMLKCIGLSSKSFKYKGTVYDPWRIDEKSSLYIEQNKNNNLFCDFDDIPSTSLPADLFK